MSAGERFSPLLFYGGIMKNELEKFVQEHDLIQRTFVSFWNCYKNYLQEYPEEAGEYQLIDRDSVQPELYGYSFVISKKFQRDFVKVLIDIYQKNETFEIGEYWCIYDENGEILDDTFVLD